MVALQRFTCLLWALVVAGDDQHQVPHPSVRYIITLKEGISARDVDSHIDWAHGIHDSTIGRRGFNHTGIVDRIELGDSFHAYVAELHPDAVDAIKNSSSVRRVEVDLPLSPRRIRRQEGSTWAQSSISHHCPHHLTHAPEYLYDEENAGQGAYVYVIDSNINVRHSEFEGRAIEVYNPGKYNHNRPHGSWVAGIVCSKTYGVAKKARLIAVTPEQKGGVGVGGVDDAFASGFVAAMQFIMEHSKKYNLLGRAVISTSLGTATKTSPAMDAAIEILHNYGLLLVSAAGNDGKDTRQTSPGSSPYALSVGAVDECWHKADFSSHGPYVYFHAPGVNIESLSHTEGRSHTASGTSAAAPIVAGLAAIELGRREYKDPKELVKTLLEHGLEGAVKGLAANVPNTLAHNGLDIGKSTCDPLPRFCTKEYGRA
ncbi:Oryzin [Purpureocillium takamizusanense]|uniref:Oryzin n=1 Tax=Purpureocillium takamizusanense TaxID=2060973 RepID=A0A9Q8QJY1_9HYPO|nr:Oryzin [Purpureocillium takamizusanense]UNI20174.1 Oryzin [Purpureocillium takamizusanense]